LDNDDLVEAKKHAQALNRLTPAMVKDSIALIEAFGFPVVSAPSEGEAQAGRLCNEGKVFAACSQDFDSLLFGTKYLIRNLSISNKRKIPGSSIYRDVPIEFYELDKVLDKLQITLDELIIVAILCGTDFNPGGIKGIGPKKALKMVREYKDRWDEIFTLLKWHDYFDHTWVDVFNVFKQMKTENVEIEFNNINKDKIREILQAHDFELMMIDRSLNGIKNVRTLDSFF
jgi:flap endonuclease-1